jgi:hypothetical protein
MARSYRLPILKDKPRNYKRTSAYWRPIRRIINQIVSTYKNRYDDSISDLCYGEDSDDLEVKIVEENSIMLGTDIPSPKSIINEYDYCDYYWDFREPWYDEEDKIKYSRK